ncbi:MAG: hypothetical protein A3H96_14045 [Acidobacteria bacterium RIFCSPLOWO2_02_FULL_67_36]|nr:MAG: hypothetical protein A3H96_14045 [Acidobacteria bacterium RIFCSPLOWO2_02_FULL_67_36]OFW18350.1 MAG: hypothetical protein A3G21_07555 [Acidobacteria bacterium RIFCSPLOWO2_12_FULL_66_21]
MATVLLLAVLSARAGVIQDDAARLPLLLYIVSESTTVRATPAPKSAVLLKLKRYDLVTGREAAPGWLQLEGADGGWIPFVRQNVARGPIETVKYRLFRAMLAKWPDAVKMDVARGRIREGFTGDQVQLALGDPLSKDLRRVADDVAEEWTYADCRILFSHSGVATIEPIGTPFLQR